MHGWLQFRLNKVQALLLVNAVRPVAADQTLVEQEGEDVLLASQIAARHLFMTGVDN